MLSERVLTPLIAIALVIGLVTIAWSTKIHRRFGPLAVTIVGSLAIGAGRLVWEVPALVYAGSGLLLVASLWNLWLKRPQRQQLVPLRLNRRTGGSP